jgi:hypothetical protein
MAAGERAPVRRLRMGAGLFGLMLASTAGLALFGTLSGFFLPNYFLSNYTQHHGILDSGTISNVTNSRTEKGSWWATVQITLDRPVDGATSTTLTVRNAVNSPDGTSVTVLVDPQDPAHAEYPGRPTNPAWVPIMFLCFTGVSALLFIFVVWRLAVIRFRNRRLPPPPAGRHRNQRGTRARSRVGGLPAIGDRGAGPDAVGGGAAADGRKVPRQWVVAPEAEEGVAAVAEMVARSPQASLVLGQVLRATETLPVLAALDVESFAYCGCQKFVRAGERHGAGRPGLGPRCPVQCGNGHVKRSSRHDAQLCRCDWPT